jgi:hypothetical protein
VETTPKSILLSGTAEGGESFVRESEPPNKTQGDRRLEVSTPWARPPPGEQWMASRGQGS